MASPKLPDWQEPEQVLYYITIMWMDAIRDAYSHAKGERLGELKDRRSRLLDDRGLHPFTLEIGRAKACEILLDIEPEARVDAVLLKRAAKRDAEAQYREEVWSAKS